MELRTESGEDEAFAAGNDGGGELGVNVSNLRQIWWILDRHVSGKIPLQKSKRPGNTRSYSRHLSACVCVMEGLAVWLW